MVRKMANIIRTSRTVMACLLLINLVALSLFCADTFHKAFVVPKLSEMKLVVISVCNLQK